MTFGDMLFGSGGVFLADGPARSVRVARQWQAISGKVFLIESVPYVEHNPLLASLPAGQARTVDSDRLNALWAKQSNRGRSLPVGAVADRGRRVASAARTEADHPLASAEPKRDRRGPVLVWDCHHSG